jgi:hypothetical protein
MKKRPRRRASNSSPSRRPSARPEPVSLQYKVAELSTVDEATLEQTVNAWVAQGWTLESIQFAMRESSKRPAMAFVFFTRAQQGALHDLAEAQARLHRLAHGRAAPGPSAARERLAELAGEGESES